MNIRLITILVAAAAVASSAHAMDPKRAQMHMDQNEDYFGKKEEAKKEAAKKDAAPTQPVDGAFDENDDADDMGFFEEDLEKQPEENPGQQIQ